MNAANFPLWLPATISFSGNWSEFVAALYAVFCRDFKGEWPRFRTCPVWHDRRVLPDGNGKEEGFWHLVTRDQWVWNPQLRTREKQRLPEFERAGRVPWARPLIDYEADSVMQVWDFPAETKKGPTIRTYIWLKAHDYLVVLERQSRSKGDIFQLITSFYVDREATRRDLQSRYERRKQ